MISTTIIVKNGSLHLHEVLQALDWCDEIVLYDTGSTDTTLHIAKQYTNVSIHQKPFIGFGPCHNEAAHLAKHDWILSIDADEIVSNALALEIQSLALDTQNVYALPRQNYFNGKHIKWCGWHPETVVRLYNRKTTSFSAALVHEGVISKGLKIIHLWHPILHYPYASLSDFLIKMERYSNLFAEQHHQKKIASPWIAIIHGLAAFSKSFFLKKGFLGGYEGFLISVYNGHTAFYKYLKLYQANKRCSF